MKTVIRNFLIALCLVQPDFLNAQIAGGIEGAITTSSVKITQIKDQLTEAVKGNDVRGFEAGVFLRAGCSHLYIKPKLLFDYQRGTLSYQVNEEKQDVTFYAGRILVPVLIGYKILPFLGIEAGPVFNSLLFSKKDYIGNEIDLKKSGMGYRFGLNAEVSILNLTLSYQGIKNSGDPLSSASYETPDQFILGLGLQFGK
jgi:hypothetical protein